MKKSKYLLSFLALLVGAGLFFVGSKNIKALELSDMLTKVNTELIPDGEKPNEGTGGSGIGVPTNPVDEGKTEDGIPTNQIIPHETPEEKEEEKKKEEPKAEKPKTKPKSNLPNTGIKNYLLTYLLLCIFGASFFIIFKPLSKEN